MLAERLYTSEAYPDDLQPLLVVGRRLVGRHEGNGVIFPRVADDVVLEPCLVALEHLHDQHHRLQFSLQPAVEPVEPLATIGKMNLLKMTTHPPHA